MTNGLKTQMEFCEMCKGATPETFTWIDAIRGKTKEYCKNCFQRKLKGGKK